MGLLLFTISIISEDTFSVECLCSLLNFEFDSSMYSVESGIENYINTDLLIIIFSTILSSDVQKYLNKYKNEIITIKHTLIIGGENCFRIFKDLQTKTVYFRYVNISFPAKKIVDEIRIFMDSLIHDSIRYRQNIVFLPQKRKEVVRYIAKGFVPQKISQIMGISTKTVSSHKRMSMGELNVKTTTELIVKYNIIDEFIAYNKLDKCEK